MATPTEKLSKSALYFSLLSKMIRSVIVRRFS